jgi:hypothetical protein
VSLALVAWLAAEASRDAVAAVLVAGLAGSAATAASFVWPTALALGLVASGGAYAALLAIDEPPLDSRGAGVAVALLTVGELVGWARELGTRTRDEPGNAWRRPVWIAGVALGALALTWTLLAVVDLARVEGLAVEAVGAAAAVAALLLVLEQQRVAARERD